MARAATSDELVLFRTPGQWSRLRAAVFAPTTIYTARANQAFSTTDSLLEITYDTGSGTLSDVKADMTLLVGSSAGAHDKGICRVRSIDATKVYIGETSDINWADNDYLTIVDDFGLWAKHVLISAGVAYMDGGVAYSNQHASPDPTPIMGSHRVLKLTGATVSASFDGSGSYVVGGMSSISGYAWVAPGSSASSGMTTATPTITWNSVGWKKVYLTVTAANGKTFLGVRYVYIWNDANLPPRARIDNCRGDAESGGWSFDLVLYDDCDLTTIRDRALVIVFAEDYYGATQQSIGPLAGSENVVVIGWIAKESITWNPEQGSVGFSAYSAQTWLSQIPAFPDGVEFTAAAPTVWTQFQNLTVDRGLWHFLHWRSTATRILDVSLSGDTRYSKVVSSLGANLWEQLREMAFLQIFARPGVDRYGRLFVEVHPQLVPAGDRNWPTVMTITTEDWEEEIVFDRVTVPPVALVNLSGVAVNSSGVGTPYFSLSPGHAYPHYGTLEMVDNVLLSSQSQSNTLAGLYRGWQNNPYPSLTFRLAANNRLLDCFPRQQCAVTIVTGDTPRGIAYSGNLLPTAVAFVHDRETGYLHTEVTFEAQTTADLGITGDIPGSRADVSVPPTPRLPPLPDFPIILPGVSEGSASGPVRVLIKDETLGLVYAENFEAASPTWRTVNAGLTSGQYQAINFLAICPNGAVYAAYLPEQDPGTGYFLARAPSIGATFVVQTIPDRLRVAAINPLTSEQIAFIDYTAKAFYLGANNSFSATGLALDWNFAGPDRLSYGLGYWLLTGRVTTVKTWLRINSGGTSIVANGTGVESVHIRASTTGITFHQKNLADVFIKGENNLATSTEVSSGQGILIQPNLSPTCGDVDPTGMYLMARNGTPGKIRSSDAGATWVAIPNLAVGNWYFRYAGSVQRWIAANATIQYTDDFGDSWTAKTGNLTSLYAFPNVRIIRVIEA